MSRAFKKVSGEWCVLAIGEPNLTGKYTMVQKKDGTWSKVLCTYVVEETKWVKTVVYAIESEQSVGDYDDNDVLRYDRKYD